MRFQVPATIVDDGETSARRWAYETVEVAEISVREAPVSIEMPGVEHAPSYRFWNGKLWRQSLDDRGGSVSRRAEIVIPDYYGGEFHPLVPTNPLFAYAYDSRRSLLADGVLKVNVPTPDSRAAVHERAATALLIGGRFHTLSAGPVGRIKPEDGGAAFMWSTSIRHVTGDQRSCWLTIGQDFEAQKAQIAEVTGKPVIQSKHDMRDGRPRQDPRIVGPLPEQTCDMATNAVEGAVANILFHLRGGRLPDTDVATVEFILELRRAYLGRWPQQAGRLALGQSAGWAFERDRIDFPEAHELAELVLRTPEQILEIVPRENVLPHRIAADRIARDFRYAPMPDADAMAMRL